MYASNVLHVKVGNNKLSNAITGSVVVRLGNNLSPNFFNIFFNDLVDIFDKDLSDHFKLGSTHFNSTLC